MGTLVFVVCGGLNLNKKLNRPALKERRRKERERQKQAGDLIWHWVGPGWLVLVLTRCHNAFPC